MAVPTIRDFLVERAGLRCEYCHSPESRLCLGLHIDHIIAIQHHGSHDSSNLAMACVHCYACKGPNIASIDPETSRLERLFDPRTQQWQEHFSIADDIILGLTPSGRVTVAILDMNNPESTQFRRLLRLLRDPVRA